MDELCFDFADLCFDFLLLHSVRARAANVLTFCIRFDIPQATVAGGPPCGDFDIKLVHFGLIFRIMFALLASWEPMGVSWGLLGASKTHLEAQMGRFLLKL